MGPAWLRDGSQFRPPAKGFTLIEVVLVLLVLALATAIAVPALLPALESVRAEAVARRAASFLDESRRRAVLSRATVTVTCDPEEGLLRMEAAGTGEHGAGAEADGAGGDGEPAVETRVFRVPERSVIVSCEPGVMSYFPQGYATGGEILLRDPRGREQRVSVGSFTGLARVASGS
jgi:prepilin-type N-terminal cleavage/methylation domain-containing protein